MAKQNLFRFDPFCLDLANQTLSRGPHLIKLRPKAFAVLVYLQSNVLHFMVPVLTLAQRQPDGSWALCPHHEENCSSGVRGRGSGSRRWLPRARLRGGVRLVGLVAADLVSAAKAGDATKVAETSQRWSANADSIARFLHGANPGQWPLATLQSAMKMHLEQTTSEVTDRLHGNYAAEVRDYDAIVAHILGMADVLSAGIMAQFPARFAGPALAATK